LFNGREELALKSLGKLQSFEREFPQGLTRVEDRSKEEETRFAAMVLMTYTTVHEPVLRGTIPIAADGSFRFQWDAKSTLTVIVESQATMGSYHMPRYHVVVLEPGRPLPSLRIDFGVSHLEGHPVTDPAVAPTNSERPTTSAP
jgi:hypothetical protein